MANQVTVSYTDLSIMDARTFDDMLIIREAHAEKETPEGKLDDKLANEFRARVREQEQDLTDGA